MIFLDASATIAGESEAGVLGARLGQAANAYTSPIEIYEAILGLARVGRMPIGNARVVLNGFLEEAQSEIIPITVEVGCDAVAAFEQFGKGRHAAALNISDCFAYACATSLDAPLLFRGTDFSQTDFAIA